MEIQKLPHGYLARGWNLIVKFKNLYQDKSAVYASVHVQQIVPVRANVLVTNLNLMAPRSVAEVAKTLDKHDGAMDWERAFPALVAEILSDYMTPTKPEQLNPAENTSPVWLVRNFILAESPVILFAPGGSGKSFLALFVSLCVQNGISFLDETDKASSLYLDWEVDKREADRRLGMLVRGLNELFDVSEYPHYLRMHMPISDVIDNILELVTEHGYRFLVIDSAACAVGGDLNDSAVVTKFFSAIRRLNACGVTTLIISHVSKADKSGDHKRSPIGSVHFENFPRIAWEIRSEFDEEAKEYRIGLFCRKSNVGSLRPIGLKMRFKENTVIVSTFDAELLDVSGEKETIQSAILSLLSERALSPREIAEELRIKPAVVYTTLSKLKAAGRIANTGRGQWAAVKTHEEVAPF